VANPQTGRVAKKGPVKKLF